MSPNCTTDDVFERFRSDLAATHTPAEIIAAFAGGCGHMASRAANPGRRQLVRRAALAVAHAHADDPDVIFEALDQLFENPNPSPALFAALDILTRASERAKRVHMQLVD